MISFNNVRDVLMRHWDPLQIGDNPNLQDEYDSYVPGLMKLLTARPSLEEVNEYLRNVEGRLEIQGADQVRMHVSKILIDRFLKL